MTQKITPCLWFDTQVKEAADFYTDIFDDSRILEITHYGPNTQIPEGSVLAVTFQLEGQHFMALNGGPAFHLTSAISLYVDCQTRQEIDEKWVRLSAKTLLRRHRLLQPNVLVVSSTSLCSAWLISRPSAGIPCWLAACTSSTGLNNPSCKE